jgi:sulfotransferase family protein
MNAKQQISPFRRATSGIRVLPDFIIIGAQKCGTTSLHHYLSTHPSVAPAARKEVHYFDWAFKQGTGWYRAHFATAPYRTAFQLWTGNRLVVGEASPLYLFHPEVPERVRFLLPDVKLIALLRDPVRRAYSHYQQRVRRGKESLSFADAIAHEAERIAAILPEETYSSTTLRESSYLTRGIYAHQLANWLTVFPREQMLILTSEEFFSDTKRVFTQVLKFLGLPAWTPPQFDPFNPGTYAGMESSTKRWLIDYFAPHNEQLYQLVGRDLGWPR